MARHIKGWGTFETEDQLFAVMDEEIDRLSPDVPGVQVRRLSPHAADVQAVAWLASEHGMDEDEIAETLGISLQTVRRILRQLGNNHSEEE